MEQVLAAIQSALNWVNDPTHKTIIAMVGNFILNRWPSFVNKAIPAVSMFVSIGLGAAQLLAAVIGAGFGGVQGASFIAVVAAEAGKPSTLSLVLDAIAGTAIPIVVSVGAHSWLKNFLQWLAAGRPLLKV